MVESEAQRDTRIFAEHARAIQQRIQELNEARLNGEEIKLQQHPEAEDAEADQAIKESLL